jgi:hypothetical protein
MTAPTNVEFSSGTTITSNWLNGVNDYVNELNPADHSASNVTYTPAGTGAVTTNVQAKLRETVSVKDFGAVGDGVTDDTAALVAAVASVSTNGGRVVLSGNMVLGATITIPNGVIVDCQWFNVVTFVDIDMFHINQGGQLKDCRSTLDVLPNYSKVFATLLPTANMQGDRFRPWIDGLSVQFASSGVGKGTGVLYDATNYYIQMTQACNISVRYGEYGVRFVGANDALRYNNGHLIVGYVNFRSTYSIHGDAYASGNVLNGVVLQGSPDGTIFLAAGRNKISGVAWDDIGIVSAGSGNDFSDLMGTTLYGISLTDTGTDTRTQSRGTTSYDHTSITTRDDARNEFRGHGRIEFRDFLFGGKDPRWTETLNGVATVTYSNAVFGNAIGYRQWMQYAQFACPNGANNALWNFNGIGLVRTNQLPKVHFTNYTNAGDARIIWEIGLYCDANNFILLRQDFSAYGIDDIQLITRANGVETVTALSTMAANRINYCSLLISDTAVTARVKQYLNTSSGAAGRVADGAYWDGTEVTATNTTNIPVLQNLGPRVWVEHGSGGATAVMYLFDYQLIAGRKSAS